MPIPGCPLGLCLLEAAWDLFSGPYAVSAWLIAFSLGLMVYLLPSTFPSLFRRSAAQEEGRVRAAYAASTGLGENDPLVEKHVQEYRASRPRPETKVKQS